MSEDEAIRDIVRRINSLWRSKQYDEIGGLLSEDAVIAPPGFDGRIRGREAFVQSYRDFDLAAKTLEFTPGDPEIDVAGNVAVAACPFFIAYEVEGATYRENGHDMLVLSKSSGQWLVVWRTVQSESTGADTGCES